MRSFDLFYSKKFEELVEKALEQEMAKPKNKNEIYNEIADHYLFLLGFLNVNTFTLFHFLDYDDCRKAAVDECEYDFGRLFCHDDGAAAEALHTIDCLIADLDGESTENILKKTEKKINARIKKKI